MKPPAIDSAVQTTPPIHARNRVRTHDGNGVGGYRCKEEGDTGHDHKGHGGLQQVVDDSQIEEEEGDNQGKHDGDYDKFHREVALSAGHLSFGITLFPRELFRGQTQSTFDDTPRADNTDDTGHGDTADADVASVVGEYLFGRRCCQFTTGYAAQQGYDDEPHEERTRADDEAVFQTHDIAETQHSGTGINLEYHLGVVGQFGTPGQNAGGEHIAPPAEGRETEIVETAYETGQNKRFGLVAGLLARHEYLCRGRGFGEGVLAVHVRYEIFAEGYEEQNAQDTSQQRAEEYLHEVDRQFGILGL